LKAAAVFFNLAAAHSRKVKPSQICVEEMGQWAVPARPEVFRETSIELVTGYHRGTEKDPR
jgi:hypothetical protein